MNCPRQAARTSGHYYLQVQILMVLKKVDLAGINWSDFAIVPFILKCAMS